MGPLSWLDRGRKTGGMKKKCIFNEKNRQKFWRFKKSPYLCTRNTEARVLLPMQLKIGIWCNGNTTDSGPVFPGSSPGIPTKRSLNGLAVQRSFFICFLVEKRQKFVTQ
jgi:hypothetical protein